MKLRQVYFPFILYVGTLVLSTHCIDYCVIRCGKEQHVACGNNGTLGPLCPENAKIIVLKENLIFKILDKHNTFRNQVAGGNVMHLSPAVRMSTMRWDPELARFALFNALKCKFHHDNCHSTTRFSGPGQNVALDTWFDPKKDVWLIMEKQIHRWFNENVFASKDDMERLGANWQKVGHFTQIVNQRNIYIGCGCVKYKKNDLFFLYFVCLYSSNNFINRSTYEAGPKAATKCRSDTNPDYANLCSINEIYNVS